MLAQQDVASLSIICLCVSFRKSVNRVKVSAWDDSISGLVK